jgi:hypothetical protein
MAQTPQVIELLICDAGKFITAEALAASGSTIIPGDLLAINAAGEVLEHATADGISQKAIALPNISNAGTIDDAYTAAETVRYGFAQPGQIAYMTLAASQTATRITPLVSNGDGTLKINAAVGAAIIAGAVVGYPVEPVTTTGATARIKVRIA